MFDDHGAMKPDMSGRRNGVLFATESGAAVGITQKSLRIRERASRAAA